MPDAERHDRTEPYRVDEQSLGFLGDLNEFLAPFEQRLSAEVPPSPNPAVIIGGLQRSGTTLLYQLLAHFAEVAYVNNLIARFWNAPLVGAMLSRALLGSTRPATWDLASEYGVTGGLLGPHEFGYFWSKWLHLDSAATHVLTDEESRHVDWPGLARALRQMAAVLEMPLVMKNPVACWNAGRLLESFPELRLVVVRRDPVFVAQSTYLARRRRYGDVTRWWSLKPPSYERIRQEPDPVRQIAAQVVECEKVFDELVASYPSKCFEVGYQDVRRRAESVVRDVSRFGGWQVREGLDFPTPDDLPDGDRRQVSPEEARLIDAALADHQGA